MLLSCESVVHEAFVQEAAVHEAFVQEAAVHEALIHEAAVQEAFVHDAAVHEAFVHEAAVQEAAVQEASALAAFVHDAASKTGTEPPAGSATTKRSRARFGLGGLVTAVILPPLTSPTPSVQPVAAVADVVSISAPLTWSGVQSEWRASRSAAIPETTGAANDVPESCMYPGATTALDRSDVSVAF